MAGFLSALGFLTIIKIPARFYLTGEKFSSALKYFPPAGFLLGLCGAALVFCANFIMPLIVTLILFAAFEIIITGGIHIDGLADTFDGVFSGRTDKAGISAIMKKGDIGVFGALAIFFIIILKIALLYFTAKEFNIGRFIETGNNVLYSSVHFNEMAARLPSFFVIIIFMFVFGRLSMVLLFYKFGHKVKKNSLAEAFVFKGPAPVFIISAISFSALFIFLNVILRLWQVNFLFSSPAIAGIAAYVPAAFAALILTILISYWTGSIFIKKTGSLSGDIIGAVCVLTEISFLFFNYILTVLLPVRVA